MSLKQRVKSVIVKSLINLQSEGFFTSELDIETLNFNVVQPNVPENLNVEQLQYDFSTNIAFVVKQYAEVKNPLAIAEKIVGLLKQDKIFKQIDIAKPGFINFILSDNVFLDVISEVLEQKSSFGGNYIKNEKLNVEFVSANPTGFLHVGHARGAAFGDSLVRIMRHAGYLVEAEYYVNDAGNQINVLTNSLWVRYSELFGINHTMPEDCYRGNDIIWAAQLVRDNYGDQFLELTEEKRAKLANIATEIMLDKIKEDLNQFNVSFNTFSSEKAIKESGYIEKTLETLKPNTYEQDGALFLKTETLGDDKDRVLVKSNGDYTYFLPDISYHQYKFSKCNKLINIFGADHSGYIQRMKIAMQYLGFNPDDLDILTIQLVRLIKDGQEFKMSKRAGTSVTLADLMDVSSTDAIRFMMLTREINNKFDFDIDFANSKDSKNPVFIVQYAHSRAVSLLDRISQDQINQDIQFTDKAKKLIVELDNFDELIKTIITTTKVNLMTQYLINLAKLFNSFYAETKLLDHPDQSTYAYLVQAVQIILQLGLNLIGVSAPKSM
ncbi:arginine--tRNA ligase [Mycoplasmopsis verecunda]|uniref:Arginine--tRNA ligase n=1 Tax=Mycoplasmopsis verecunda TaxID=171291 RepID=A0A1T4LJG8_9BACT|nr:arginine--tRNA ligase [Mycoplasmopsis verecunda]WPB54421.1 arginine--tRNA ligase [Mycoplasmopsis verecunda]SJZ54845.1 arginyl-tRNA synthetase [Mycoplasmopsis verecunda]